MSVFFFFQAEDGIRDKLVTGVQTCALPICRKDLVPMEFGRRRKGRSPHRGRIQESEYLPGKQRRRWSRGESIASSGSQPPREFPLSSGNSRAFGQVQKGAELPGAPR